MQNHGFEAAVIGNVCMLNEDQHLGRTSLFYLNVRFLERRYHLYGDSTLERFILACCYSFFYLEAKFWGDAWSVVAV